MQGLRIAPLVIALAGSLLVAACGPRSERKVIQIKGSNTLYPAAQAWVEAYAKVDGNVAISVAGGGSGTGIAALLDGTVDIATCSRQMAAKEIEAAKKRGITPVEHVTGYDAIAIFVHKNNPIRSITIAQLAAIYGEGGEVVRWSQIGVALPGADKDPRKDEIVRIGRDNSSGTYEYFREAVLGKGRDYKLGSIDAHGSKEVVEQVSHIVSAIGYSGLAFASDDLRTVPVAAEEGTAPVAPSVASAADSSYPLARPLYLYTAGEPAGPVGAFLSWVVGEHGQQVLADKGYAPLQHR